MHRTLALMLLTALPTQLCAAPEHYRLAPELSRVVFMADMGGRQLTGRFPIRSTDILLDFADLSRCRISVTLDIAGASADMPLAADALKGATIFDAQHFPRAVFTSTSVSGTAAAAQVSGLLTLRGSAQPIILQAEIMRQRGSAEGDLSRMTVHLTGQIRRSEYGATGWADVVGDVVLLDILARITRSGP